MESSHEYQVEIIFIQLLFDFYVILVNSLSKFKNFSKNYNPNNFIYNATYYDSCMQTVKNNKIEFSIHEYEHDSNAKSFGLEAAEKLNLDVREVFKTLMVSDDKNFFVAVLPVNHQLNLKKWLWRLAVKIANG